MHVSCNLVSQALSTITRLPSFGEGMRTCLRIRGQAARIRRAKKLLCLVREGKMVILLFCFAL